MKYTNSNVPVYTVAGSSSSRNLPEWLSQRKRNKDAEYNQRVELLQDFEFEEASQCIRVSDDGEWVMSTGTYKPQIHTHFLPNLALSWARHTDTINKTFRFLSSDYSKSVHLQEDRSIEFHTPGGCHYSLRTPRYGRDLLYDKASAELLIPSVGVNASGMGEVFRVNLEVGRFMNEFEVDVGGDDMSSMGGGALQGGIRTGSVNVGAIAEETHGLYAFGTSIGTVEYWDPRARMRVAALAVPVDDQQRPEVTALSFHYSGIKNAVGTSSGLIYLFDLRSPVHTLKKDHGYGYPVQHLQFLNSSTTTRAATSEPKILSGDKRILKIWDERDGTPWTSVEPAVDINCVAWCPNSGMILTANEGKQQHAFLIPQLGPAPKWCSFLDNVVEEMAEDPNDPNAFSGRASGEVYDNFKFLTAVQLQSLNLDHLIGKTNLLRPYMHGYFVDQQLYEEARLIANPSSWEAERAKRVQQKIDKERESRIRGNKKVTAKVNRNLAEKILEREAKNERRRAQRVLAQGGDETPEINDNESAPSTKNEQGLLADSRFARLFQDEEFAVDESSREFKQLNPSTKTTVSSNLDHEKGLTAVEEEALDSARSSDDEDSGSGAEERNGFAGKPDGHISSANYKRSSTKNRKHGGQMSMQISHSEGNRGVGRADRDRSFRTRASNLKGRGPRGLHRDNAVAGDKTITFEPSSKSKQTRIPSGRIGSDYSKKDRRSASGNTFRRM